jgi:hypothetical protein
MQPKNLTTYKTNMDKIPTTKKKQSSMYASDNPFMKLDDFCDDEEKPIEHHEEIKMNTSDLAFQNCANEEEKQIAPNEKEHRNYEKMYPVDQVKGKIRAETKLPYHIKAINNKIQENWDNKLIRDALIKKKIKILMADETSEESDLHQFTEEFLYKYLHNKLLKLKQLCNQGKYPYKVHFFSTGTCEYRDTEPRLIPSMIKWMKKNGLAARIQEMKSKRNPLLTHGIEVNLYRNY